MPNSSPVTANTKSVCASGRMRLYMPSPGPRPSQPPERMLCSAVSTWNVSMTPPLVSGSMKCSMRS